MAGNGSNELAKVEQEIQACKEQLEALQPTFPNYDAVYLALQQQLAALRQEKMVLRLQQAQGTSADAAPRSRPTAGPDYQEYADQLPQARFTTGPFNEQWLGLVEGGWPGRNDSKDPIMMRPCYNVLLDKLKGLTGPETGPVAVIVTGTPGIGKSSFGYVFMHSLAMQQQQFVYDVSLPSGSGRLRLLFDYTGPTPTVEQGTSTSFEGVLSRGNVWLIYDDMVPEVQYKGSVRILCLSSPKPHHFSVFGKQGVIMFHLPPLRLSEQKAIWQKLRHNDMQFDDVLRLRCIYGGVATGVVSRPRPEEAAKRKRDLDAALDSAPVGTLKDLHGSSGFDHRLPHKLLYFQVDPEQLTPICLKLGSVYIADKLVKRLQKDAQNQLRSLLDSVKGVPELANIAAAFFEGGSHSALLAGGKFTYKVVKAAESAAESAAGPQPKRPRAEAGSTPEPVEPFGMEEEEDLGGDDGSAQDVSGEQQQQQEQEEEAAQPLAPLPQITVPAGLQREWDVKEGIDGSRVHYVQPTTVNNAAWDGFLILQDHAYIMQMTTAATHGVLQQHVIKLLKRVQPLPAKVDFCFVVPEYRFQTFKAQNWLTTKGTKVVSVHPMLQNMRQLVIKMDDAHLMRRSSSDSGNEQP